MKHIWLVRYVDEDSSGVYAYCETKEVAEAIRDQLDADEVAEYGRSGYRYYYSVHSVSLTTPLDPKPWVYALLGEANEHYAPARESEQVTGGFVFRPREGFIQDRKAYGV